MSLSDLFRRKQPAPAKPSSPWQQRLAQAERARRFQWRDDNDPARAFVRELLTDTATIRYSRSVTGRSTRSKSRSRTCSPARGFSPSS
jgi:hypothetical protein